MEGLVEFHQKFKQKLWTLCSLREVVRGSLGQSKEAGGKNLGTWVLQL